MTWLAPGGIPQFLLSVCCFFHESSGADTHDLQVWEEAPPFRLDETEKEE
jgi:hypothetical protein